MIATPRLRFREMTDADLDELTALLGDPGVMRFYPRPRTRAEAQQWIDWNKRNYAEHGFGLWVLELTATGEFAGDCGLTYQHPDGVRELEIGYHLRTALQGQGLATEAAVAVRDHARTVLRAPRLTAIINPANIPSQRVAGKIGLTLEKRAGNGDLIFAGALTP
ncbi:GNAT family N-acetyltransferase [Actinoplanes sp. N902-109]|uniref:GNAT family N-acetyltransferase n=1 Tax=Actinoplanes sp. (strain N902-109) TaxID=649831 RepID=UPI000329552C|nr:GNAT family N-acetyltransferase [Actinoplanes sp. N902-109]AGL19659.1 ribosomal-protein-alanine acetyltransferase [Actinoplanes sp. N902-109]